MALNDALYPNYPGNPQTQDPDYEDTGDPTIAESSDYNKLDNEVLKHQELLKDHFVYITGSTMTGPLILHAAPTVNLQAATKKYVDDAITGENYWDRNIIASELRPYNANDTIALGSGNFSTTGIISGASLNITGTSELRGEVDLNSNKIISVLDPTSAQDAATKIYVDTNPSFVYITGSTMTGPLTLNAAPTIDLQAATKKYVDDSILIENLWDRTAATAELSQYNANDNLALGSGNIRTTGIISGASLNITGVSDLRGELDMNSNKIVSLTDPTADQDAATKKYVDDSILVENLWNRTAATAELSQYNANDNLALGSGNIRTTGIISGASLNITGTSELRGEVDLNSNKIISVLDPTSAQDAATKIYVDTNSSFVYITGSTMTGPLTLNAAPTIDLQAATKKYVDDSILIENLWNRTAATSELSQYYANDNLELGSGHITTTGIISGASLTITDDIDFAGSNIVYVPLDGDIETYVTNATAGDTLVLAAGTYTITSGITVDKKLHIKGQGKGITTISCSTDNVNMISITASGSLISDMTLSRSGALITGSMYVILGAANFDVSDIAISVTATGGNTIGTRCIGTTTSSITFNLYNVSLVQSGSYAYAYLVDIRTNAATANLYNCTASLSSALTSTTAANIVIDGLHGTINIYDCNFSAASASSTSSGIINSNGSNAVINVYGSTINSSGASTFDVDNITGTIKLTSCTLVNGTTSGTITYDGTVATGKVHAATDNATTNAVTDVIRLDHTTTGTAANNIGTGLTFFAEDASANTDEVASIDAVLTCATHATQSGALVFSVQGNEKLRIAERVITILSGSQITPNYNATNALQITDAVNTQILSVDTINKRVQFGPGSTPALYVDETTGYVGIGTSTPSKKFVVIGDGSFSTDLLVSGTLNVTTQCNFPTIYVDGIVGKGHLNLPIASDSARTATLTGGTALNLVSTTGDIKLNIGSTTGIIVKSSTANIGIGTTIPSIKTHIVTDDATTNAITDILRLDHTTTGTAADNIGTGLTFYVEDASANTDEVASIDGVLTCATHATQSGALVFSVQGNEKLRIAERIITILSGSQITPNYNATNALQITDAISDPFVTFDAKNKYVGVGTTTPSGKFSVGSAAGQNAYFFYDNADVADTQDGPSLYIYRRAAEGDTYLRFYTTQYTGITITTGTTDPLYIDSSGLFLSQEARGNVSIFSASSSGLKDKYLYQSNWITAASAVKYIAWQLSDTDDKFHLTRQDTNILGFDVAMPTSITLNDATTNAVTDTLSLYHTTTGTAADNIGTGFTFNSEDSAGNTDEVASIDAVFTRISSGNETGAMIFSVLTTEQMRLESTGYAGFGTSTPTERLDVNGNIKLSRNAADIIINDNTGASLEIKDTSVTYLTFNTTDTGAKMTAGSDFEIGSLQVPENAGAVTFVDFPVTSAATAAVEESYAFQIQSSTQLKIYAESDGAGSVQNRRVETEVLFKPMIEDNVTSTVTDVVRIQHTTTGAAINNFGTGLTFYTEDTSGNIEETASIDAILTCATHATQSGALVFSVQGNEKLRIAERVITILSGSQITPNYNATNALQITDAVNTQILSVDTINKRVQFGPGSTPALYVDEITGYIGVGTISPNSKFYISGNATNTESFIYSGGASNYAALVLSRTGTTNATADGLLAISQWVGSFSALAAGAGDLVLRAQTKNLILTAYNSNSGNILFGIGVPDTEKMRIDSTGKIGIGTVAPSIKTHIVTDDATTNAITDILRLDHTTTGTASDNIGTGLTFYAEDSAGNTDEVASIDAVLTRVSSANETGAMIFSVLSTEQMRLESTGFSGFGTSTPTERLDVNGNIRLSRNAADIIINDNTGASLEIKDLTTSYLTFNSTDTGAKMTAGVDFEIGSIELPTNAGAVTFADLIISSGAGLWAASGVEESYAFQIQSATQLKVYAESDGKGGVQNQCITTEVLFKPSIEDGIRDAVTDVVRIQHTTSGAALNNFGTGLTFYAEDASGNIEEAASIDAILTCATHSTQSGALVFSVQGNEKMRVAEKTITIGSGTTKTDFDVDATGQLTITSPTAKTPIFSPPVYEDLRIVPTSFDFVGNTDPTLVAYTPTGSGTATMLYEFAKNDVAYFVAQVPHNYKEGTDITVHVHWTPGSRGTEEGTNLVGWKVLYAWTNIDAAFPAMQTADLSDACTSTDDAHLITPEVTLNGHTVPKTISSMLICQVTRTDTNGDDTWASSTTGQLPLILEVDFHYQIDTLGSRQILTK